MKELLSTARMLLLIAAIAVVVTVPCTATAAQQDPAAENAQPAIAQNVATDDGLAMTPTLVRPIPYPSYCYQGRVCDERLDCGYDPNYGGYQGDCYFGTCVCY